MQYIRNCKQSSSGYGKTDMNINEQITKKMGYVFTQIQNTWTNKINTNGNTVTGTNWEKQRTVPEAPYQKIPLYWSCKEFKVSKTCQ